MIEEYKGTGFEVAIIGMSARFPGAKNIDEFWENLKNGVETITFFNKKELEEAGVSGDKLNDPDFVKARSILEGAYHFDADFFGYTYKEAELMIPQMRLFHECAWAALEDAGYWPEAYDGLIGLYVGANPSFSWEALTTLSGKVNDFGGFASVQLVNKDFISSRVAYKLNLTGPILSMNTACSTSLVAVHLACQALINGECDMVLAGGVCLVNLSKEGYMYQEGMTFSPDGHCRAFDAKAKGTISGEGIGIVVLKRFTDAVSDRDHIYALIKGSAVNNDGIRKVGFSAPSIEGQAEVIKAAMQMAEVEPESIGYIETHGTGTELGDPVEIEALNLAYHTKKKKYCAIGSVKSNIGHLDSAAGVAGLIKTVLALKHKLIPPSLHFQTPNRKIDFEHSPFMVNRGLVDWKNDGHPLRAGVSSFGIGGTNAHVILEEFLEGTRGLAPLLTEQETLTKPRDYQLILLSAKTETALQQMTQNLADHFKKHPGLNLADAAYTLHKGRKSFKYRQKLVCTNAGEAVDILSSADPRKKRSMAAITGNKTVVFMFPGLGPQYVNMGWDLYQKESVFRQEMDRCFEILAGLLEDDIKEVLYPGLVSKVSKVSEVSGGSSKDHMATRTTSHEGCVETPLIGSPCQGVHQIEIAQLVIFVFEYALARLLMHWGIKPDALVGYSIGEYTAACLSGVFSLEDALKLIVIRGQLVQRLPAGTMLSIPLPAEQVRSLKEEFISLPGITLPGADQLSLAIDNGPSCIVSGPREVVAAFEQQLKQEKLVCIRLKGSHAIHSRMMAPIAAEFEKHAARTVLNEPQIPYISNVSGTWITLEEAWSPQYWANHLQQTVKFASGIQQLLKRENVIFIEVGPDRDLCTLLAGHINNNTAYQPVNLVRHPGHQVSDLYYLLSKIGQLWLYGVDLDWEAFYSAEMRGRVSLPHYPFERKLYWIDSRTMFSPGSNKVKPADTLTQKEPDIADWFYYPSWVRARLDPNSSKEREKTYRWLVFQHPGEFCRSLIDRLEQKGHEVITVTCGKEYHPLQEDAYPGSYILNPENEGDYHRLLEELKKQGKLPHRIVHSWSITGTIGTPGPGTGGTGIHPGDIPGALAQGFYSIIYLARALGKQNIIEEIQMEVVSDHLHRVTGQEVILPQKAPLLGPLKVIPQEYAFIRCRNVDIQLPEPGNSLEEALIDRLVEEFTTKTPDTVVAYRDNYRWVQTYRPIRFGPEEAIPQIKEKGIYLITGGLGRVGLTLARYLVESAKVRVVLTGRSPFPSRDQWEQYLSGGESPGTTVLKIRKLLKLEEMGGKILTFSVDVTDPQGMQEVINLAEEQLGGLNGIIHAAGETDISVMRSIEQLQPPDCQKQFAAKIYGLLNLYTLVKNRKLDFCWLTSSLSPILGGLGLSAYAAGNHFMDAFAHYCQQHSRNRWISVNWADWTFAPGTPDGDKEDTQSSQKDIGQVEWGMKPREGVETFRRILFHCLESQVVVSTVNLQARIDQWVKLESLRQEQPSKQTVPSYAYKSRPQLENPFVKPSNYLEQNIADVLQDFLGIEEVGIDDNFYELGATSLNIIQINSKVREKLKMDISVMRWFEYPTIKALTGYLLETEVGLAPSEEEIDRSQTIDKGINKLKKIKQRTRN